jgi:hypothetical protein
MVRRFSIRCPRARLQNIDQPANKMVVFTNRPYIDTYLFVINIKYLSETTSTPPLDLLGPFQLTSEQQLVCAVAKKISPSPGLDPRHGLGLGLDKIEARALSGQAQAGSFGSSWPKGDTKFVILILHSLHTFNWRNA